MTVPVDLDDARSLALTGARRIALVGASPDPTRDSHRVMGALLDAGYEVVPVNPGVDAVHGVPAVDELAAVPGRIDVVDVFRAPQHLPAVARAAVRRDDVAVVWNQYGLVSVEARSIVRAAGRGYVEDHCLAEEVERSGTGPPAGPRLEHAVVLLDLDDTILDHVACERGAVVATLRAFELDASDLAVDTYVRHNALLWEEYRDGMVSPVALRNDRWERTLQELGLTADVGAVSAHYLEEFAGTGQLLARSAEAVWWLGRRAHVAICTNGFREVQQQRLAATGLGGLVDVLVSSEEAGVAKPDPTSLRIALERLGVGKIDPSGVAVVGDQLATDIAAGHALGGHTVWVAPDDAVVPEALRAPHVRVAALADIA